METKKSASANIESVKSIFFKIGLIITLILVFTAFQYRSYNRGPIVITGGKVIPIDDELTQITIPKPPPPPPAPLNDLILVPEDIPLAEEFKPQDIEGTESTVNPDITDWITSKPEDTVIEDIVFSNPEVMPEFPGGVAALYRYLSKNLVYPYKAKENNIQGTVFLAFVVEKDGSISNLEILRGIGGGCDEEALRVVQSMPRWIPGKMGIHAVRVSFSIPIRFKLE